MRDCTRCGIEKPDAEFSTRTDRASGKTTYCRSCQSEYHRAWRAANRARYTAKKREWDALHPDRVAAKDRRYRQRNPEKCTAWREARRDSKRHRLSLWAQRPDATGATMTLDAVLARFDVHGWKCHYCGRALTWRTVEADHRIPLTRGGRNCASNIVPACKRCNSSKGARTETEYRQRNQRQAVLLEQ